MSAPNGVGYFCGSCLRIEWHPFTWRLLEWREPVPHYQYRFYNAPVCWCGDDMTAVDLCLACDVEGKVERTYEDLGLCLKHAQMAEHSKNLRELIREIALLPAKLRT